MLTAPELTQRHQLCRLRSTLEAFAAALLPTCPGRDAVFEELERCAEGMRAAAARADYERFHRGDLAFHRALIDSAGLPALRDSWERVSADLDAWLQRLKREVWPNLMTLHYEHQLLLDALRSPLQWVGEQALHQHIEAGWHRIAFQSGSPGVVADPVARAEAFISTHFASDIAMEFVARNVSFVSLSHLNRLFRQKAGVSPYARLRQTRIHHAAELLRQGEEAVASVGKRVGYRNASHFVRDFRALMGATPARYRKGVRREMLESDHPGVPSGAKQPG